MANTLTLSPKTTPFPYAAVATAAYTSKAEVVYDDAATTATLDLDGSHLTDEAEIVAALAQAGGVANDSNKVCSI
jgi:glutamyl-tRNA synthetase